MNVDGTGVMRLTSSSAVDASPDWSPDGTTIALTSDRTGLFDFEIWAMNADGSRPTQLTNERGDSIRWSRDGTRLSFASNRHGLLNFDIFTMNAGGSDARRLTLHGSLDLAPNW